MVAKRSQGAAQHNPGGGNVRRDDKESHLSIWKWLQSDFLLQEPTEDSSRGSQKESQNI